MYSFHDAELRNSVSVYNAKHKELIFKADKVNQDIKNLEKVLSTFQSVLDGYSLQYGCYEYKFSEYILDDFPDMIGPDSSLRFLCGTADEPKPAHIYVGKPGAWERLLATSMKVRLAVAPYLHHLLDEANQQISIHIKDQTPEDRVETETNE